MKACSLDEARAAKPSALEVFERVGNVVGVGITRIEDGYGLKVNLSQLPGKNVTLPTEVKGVPVRVEVVGKIRKRDA